MPLAASTTAPQLLSYVRSPDNRLAHMDQVSFLALRTLGYGTLAQVTWVYNRPVNTDGLRHFHHNLGYGLLGRGIERPPLPFARDRWIAGARGHRYRRYTATARRRQRLGVRTGVCPDRSGGGAQ